MRLLAISDLHVSHARNRDALAAIGSYPDDWLIVAGDVGEKADHLRYTLDILCRRFAKVIWTPGNHDLWCPPDAPDRTRGLARYEELVGICRAWQVATPEDPYLQHPAPSTQHPAPSTQHSAPSTQHPALSTQHPALSTQHPALSTQHPALFICPLFCLYDYSFHPAEVRDPLAWARESGVVCGDEWMLSPDPWPSRAAWCEARVAWTDRRLAALPEDASTVLISHWPLRYDLARPPRIPRFSIWCGTTRTEEWPRRYRARVVINGHLHMRTSLVRHGVRHEEVSLGYPRDWRHDRGIDYYLRDVSPFTRDGEGRFAPARDPFIMLCS